MGTNDIPDSVAEAFEDLPQSTLRRVAKLCDKASAAMSAGNDQAALKLARRALDISARIEPAHAIVACASFRLGHYEEAVSHSCLAPSFLKTNAIPNIVLGRSYVRLSKNALAKAAFEQALEIDPSNDEVRAEMFALERDSTTQHQNGALTESRLLLTPAECDGVIAFGAPTLRPAMLEAENGNSYQAAFHAMTECLIDVRLGMGFNGTPELAAVFGKILEFIREAKGEQMRLWPQARFVRYQTDQQFAWHRDDRPGRPKGLEVAVSVQLSAPASYSGGVLEVTDGSQVVTAPKDRGSVTVFDALLLHRVTTITRGERYALIVWGVDGQPKVT